jgi:homoserine kinase type II
MISAYERLRPLGGAEIEALPLLARGAALRFMLTRLVDWLNVPTGAKVAPKNPLEYRDKLRFHQRVRSASDYGLMR